MEYTRKHKGTCSKSSTVVVEDGIIKDVQVIGGCDGNLKGIMKIMIGLPAQFVIDRFRGTPCMKRPTSCPDQIAITLEEALAIEAKAKEEGKTVEEVMAAANLAQATVY